MKSNILICGAGIIGLTIAKKLIDSGCDDICIIEKESQIGMHASGRNSGVLHAGIYYSSDSLKAQFCLKGNQLMKDFCHSNGLTVLDTGKVIVAKNESEVPVLDELYERAKENGAKVKLIDEKELHDIEPNAKTIDKALYSYYTAVIDPKQVLKILLEVLLQTKKLTLYTDCRFVSSTGQNKIKTKNGDMEYKYFINAGGAYSDKIAHSFDIGLNYRLIPFKGIYRKLKADKNSFVNGNIYPVPDIRNPFLGVHYTKGIDGNIYLGPTAIPAFGRENYHSLKGLSTEIFDILYRNMILFFKNPKYRNIALTEPKKYLPKPFFSDVKKMVKEIHPNDIISSTKAGIRPQLVDWDKKELVMDFLVMNGENSTHLLNTISPAFTSSMAFSDFVAEKYILPNINC